MAGDWIKFEKATIDKPEVHGIASALNLDPDAVIGKLLRVWTWFDENTPNGDAPSVTVSLLDRLSFAPGFAKAMSEVGWLVLHGPIGVTLPNFARHNGETAKKRALGRKRNEKYRLKVTQHVTQVETQPVTHIETQVETQNASPEKRREESKPKNIAPLPKFDPVGYLTGFGVDESVARDWLAVRKAKKAPPTETALAIVVKEAEKAGVSMHDAILRCCQNNWAGFKASWPESQGSQNAGHYDPMRGAI